jgi:uncharacterized protein (AIM24 family)
MYKIHNFTQNDDIDLIQQAGPFAVAQYKRDLSVSPETAQMAWFGAQMNIRKRQLLCNVSASGITLQAGAMQWTVGDVNATTGVKGVGDLLGKAVRGKATGESAIKPEYVGNGMLVTEPTYKYLNIMHTDDWGGSVVLEDGLFLACESTLKHRAVMRSNLSSAALGNEGLFNLTLTGSGYFVIEADCPREELITVELENDELKIDGNYAIAWSTGLQFTVERSGKSLIGSAASGEGLVNVYRGTGKVAMMPVR